MPGYHTVVASKAKRGGGTVVKCTMRPKCMATYEWNRPIAAFQFPMDAMTQIPGITIQSYDELLAELRSTAGSWWIARICRNYEHGLESENFFLLLNEYF